MEEATRILIVDDEKTYREQLTTILQDNGYTVRAAANAEASFDIIAEFTPDLLITDWRLQNALTGTDLAARLREALPDLRMIIMTGFSRDEVANDKLASNTIILEKPFGIDALLEAVSTALRK
jgi:DNA-binding NtrC family response regulator